MTRRAQAPADKTVSSSRRIEGALVSVRDGVAKGWVWDMDAPYEALSVDIFCGDTRMARTVADQFDVDLAMARKGNGAHAFSTVIETWPDSKGPYSIQAFVSGTTQAIGDSLTISTRRELQLSLSDYACHVQIDGFSTGHLIGWVTDQAEDISPPTLTLLIDGAPTSVAASITPAKDIPSEGRLASGWRFSVSLPTSLLDGLNHSIDISVARRPFSRDGGPLSIGPTDIPSIGQGLQTLTRRLQDVERRLGALPQATSPYELAVQLSGPMLDQMDSLLALHQDAVERELAIYRKAFFDSKDSAARNGLATITGAWPSASGGSRDRSPRYAIDIDAALAGSLSGDIDIVPGDEPALRAFGRAELILPDAVRPGEAVIIEGRSSFSLENVFSWTFSLNGSVLRGRLERWPDGRWRFTSRLTRNATRQGDQAHQHTLALIPDGGWIGVEGLSAPLEMTRLYVTASAIPPAAGGLPVDFGVHIAGSGLMRGWYSPDEGEFPYCWMADRAMLPNVPTRSNEGTLTIIGESELMPGGAETLGLIRSGVPTPLLLEPQAHPLQKWTGRADLPAVSGPDGGLWLVADPSRVSTPEIFAGSPDARRLSVSVRAVMFEGVKADGDS